MNSLLFILFLLFTFLLLLGYERGRRKNIKLMKDISRLLEEIIEPEDKEYTLIGGVAGFKALYRKGEVEVRALLVLLPRMSLLYLPLSYLLGRRDRLILKVKRGGGEFEYTFDLKDKRNLEEEIKKKWHYY